MDMKGIRICHPKIWRLGILNNIFTVKKCEKQQIQEGLSNLPLLPWSTSLRPSCKRCPPYTQKTEGCWEESKRTVSPSLRNFTHTFSPLVFSHTFVLYQLPYKNAQVKVFISLWRLSELDSPGHKSHKCDGKAWDFNPDL